MDQTTCASSQEKQPMQKVEYQIALANDRSLVRIQTVVDGVVQAWSDTSAEELSGVIEMFMTMRMQLMDEVPRELDPGSRVVGIEDPIWRGGPGEDRPGIHLAIRHPGIGWLGFHLPEESAKSLRDLLNKTYPGEVSNVG
jgi:hypothetical protein